jgi:adenine-specific DNA-methyltransferase
MNQVPNSHLVEQFEEVIDALVYELYFEEDFRSAEIEFLKFAARDFKSIEGLEKQEKIAVIHNAYQTLRNKENEICNNLKLMDIRIEDLIMPIKNAR